ncbi:MAG: GDP-mannose 4,6-dehydratase [Cyanobacteria bacterium P01_G01_bin.54]
MSNRFLVLGSNSFSGAHFVRYLLDRGDIVIGSSRSEEPNYVFTPYRWQASPDNFQFVQCDINTQLDELLGFIKDFQPEYIVNFIAQGMVAQSWQIPEHWYQTNVVGQVKLHDQLRHLKFLKRYVHVTTPEVYGSTEGWHKESFAFAPSTPYAVSRAACDWHLLSFFNAYNFPVVFTRSANVYGPGQQVYRIIPRTMLYARLGKVLQLHGGGKSIRSFIHIQDVADATYRIALNGKVGEAYHISTKQTISIHGLVEKICSLVNLPFSALVEIASDRLGKDQAYLLDSSRLRDDLGWCNQIALDAGLSETLAWVDENLDTLKALPLNYSHKP